ncbi:MAG: hypothetical protein ACI4MU_02215 [Candidatus Ventricola sp.]
MKKSCQRDFCAKRRDPGAKTGRPAQTATRKIHIFLHFAEICRSGVAKNGKGQTAQKLKRRFSSRQLFFNLTQKY